MFVKGTGSSSGSIALEVDLPSTVRVGDTFVFGADDDQEEVEIVGMERGTDSEGVAVTTLNVAPFPEFTYKENGHDRSHHRARHHGSVQRGREP